MNQFRDTSLTIQKLCTQEQFLLDKTPTIGIHGIAGSFTDEALKRFTQEVLHLTSSDYEISELVHADSVLRATHKGEVDFGIFAFANSGSGGYVASIEAMGQYSYELVALFTMPIVMCLLAHPSIETVKQLREFRGHPVAIAQCRHTLNTYWPTIPVHPDADTMDTALSAQLLAQGGIAPTSGIFASMRAAELYGLRILHNGVHHDPNNATCFAIIRRAHALHAVSPGRTIKQ